MERDAKIIAMEKALSAYFNEGMRLKDVPEFTDGLVSSVDFKRELDRLTCMHPSCTEYHPCRAAKRRSGGIMVCTALYDTDFGYDRNCPFFKTPDDYKMEFIRTYDMEKPVVPKRRIRRTMQFKIPKGGRKDV